MIYQILAVISFALISGNFASVSAADLTAGRGIKDTCMPAPVTSHMAWYVRGDIGYAMHADPDITESGLYDLDSTSMDDTWTVSLGIGRSFSSNIRGDITWDHRFDPCGCTGGILEKDKGSVAAALMAGMPINFGGRTSYGGSIKDAPVAIDTRGPWNPDAGYRFLYLGEVRTGDIVANPGPGPAIAGDKVKDIMAHELRIGRRYDIH